MSTEETNDPLGESTTDERLEQFVPRMMWALRRLQAAGAKKVLDIGVGVGVTLYDPTVDGSIDDSVRESRDRSPVEAFRVVHHDVANNGCSKGVILGNDKVARDDGRAHRIR